MFVSHSVVAHSFLFHSIVIHLSVLVFEYGLLLVVILLSVLCYFASLSWCLCNLLFVCLCVCSYSSTCFLANIVYHFDQRLTGVCQSLIFSSCPLELIMKTIFNVNDLLFVVVGCFVSCTCPFCNCFSSTCFYHIVCNPCFTPRAV